MIGSMRIDVEFGKDSGGVGYLGKMKPIEFFSSMN